MVRVELGLGLWLCWDKGCSFVGVAFGLGLGFS